MNPLEKLTVIQGREVFLTPTPLTQWLSPRILEAKEGQLTIRYDVRKDMLNPAGTLHGGVTAAIVDDTIGATIYTLDQPYFYTTINNVIDYFSPTKEGDVITVKTQIIKKGRQFINAQCEIYSESTDRMLARGISNLFKTDHKI